MSPRRWSLDAIDPPPAFEPYAPVAFETLKHSAIDTTVVQ